MLGMSVKKAQKEIDAKEFAEWIAFERTNPSGERRADIRSALICYVIASVMGGKKYTMKDFMIDFEKSHKASQESIKIKLMAWANTHNSIKKKE